MLCMKCNETISLNIIVCLSDQAFPFVPVYFDNADSNYDVGYLHVFLNEDVNDFLLPIRNLCPNSPLNTGSTELCQFYPSCFLVLPCPISC